MFQVCYEHLHCLTSHGRVTIIILVIVHLNLGEDDINSMWTTKPHTKTSNSLKIKRSQKADVNN